MKLEFCCLAKILGRSWRKGTASRQASELQGYGDCGKKKTSQDEVRLEAGLKASLWSLGGGLTIRTRNICLIPQASLEADLKTGFQAHGSIEIRTQHVEAGLKAGLRGGPPQFRAPAADVACVESAAN